MSKVYYVTQEWLDDAGNVPDIIDAMIRQILQGVEMADEYAKTVGARVFPPISIEITPNVSD